jgi:type IV pilus modification protein PilV
MKKTFSKGFTLMEVLVALAVLSIGLLGMAGMQLFSLKSSHNAYLRTQATTAAHELVNKMRANREEALAGSYDTALTAIPNGFTNCMSGNCSTLGLANFEVAEWKCALGSYAGNAPCSGVLDLNSILPNGDGSVVRNGNVFTITVQWTDRSNSDANTPPENVMVMAEL